MTDKEWEFKCGCVITHIKNLESISFLHCRKHAKEMKLK